MAYMSDEYTYEELQKLVAELQDRSDKAEELYRSLFNNSHSIMLIIHPECGNIIDANEAACEFYGYTKDEILNMRIMDINMLSEKQVLKEMQKAKLGKCKVFNFRHRLSSGDLKDVEVFSGPIILHGEKVLYSIINDISERMTFEQERECLITKLEQTLAEVKILRGILPICATCKKIRDDKGNWNHMETYISTHSGVAFTHGICPECQEEFYSSLNSDKGLNKE